MFYIQKPDVFVVGKNLFTTYSAHCKILRKPSKEEVKNCPSSHCPEITLHP